MKIDLSIEINAAPEAVFAWVADPEKAMRWQQGVGEVAYTRRTANLVGTMFSETMEEGGSKLEMQGEVTGYEPGRSISFHIRSRIHEFNVTHAVEGIEGGTRFRSSADIRWKFPMGMMSLFMGKKLWENITAQSEAELRKLKELCEGGAQQAPWAGKP